MVLPDLDAGCSLADDCPADEFADFRAQHPDHLVVSYINCTAAVKAQSDLICTSSNAGSCQAIPKNRPVLFAPDQNLDVIQRQSGRELTLWPGRCIVHETFSEEAVLQLKLEHPDAEVIAHPECQQNLLDLADFIGSTSKLLGYTEVSNAETFIVLTEPGIIHQMKQRVPNKTLLDVPGLDGCSCNACPHMRLNTLEKLQACLETSNQRLKWTKRFGLGLEPIQRMLEMSFNGIGGFLEVKVWTSKPHTMRKRNRKFQLRMSKHPNPLISAPRRTIKSFNTDIKHKRN